MACPLPKVHLIQRKIESGHVDLEIPSYLEIFSMRVVAPEFVLQGTCIIEKYDFRFGFMYTGIIPVHIFNSITAFPISKSLTSHDRIDMKFYFQMPNLFPENEWLKLFIISES